MYTTRYHEIPELAGSENQEPRGLVSPLNPFLSYRRWFLRHGVREQNGVPSVFRRWVAREVTTRLVTLAPPTFCSFPLLPSLTHFKLFPWFVPVACTVFGFPVFLAASERDLINPKSCNSSGAQAVKLGMLSGGASSLQSFGGAAQRRVGTGVPIQRRLQRPPPPPSPGIRAAPQSETCTLKWLILSLQPPELPKLRATKASPRNCFFPPVFSLQLRVF